MDHASRSPASAAFRAVIRSVFARLGETLDCMAVEAWALTDGWVLASIEGTSADDGYTLTQILIKAEGINHAGLLEDEFTRAVPRLLAAGLIGADPALDRYWHTPVGRELYEKAMRRRGLFGWIDGLPPAFLRQGQPKDSPWSLPTGAFERADRECRNRYQGLGGSKTRPAK